MPRKRMNGFEEDLKDLGFGSKVTQQSHFRMLNHDGSFNVERVGLPLLRKLSFYHSILTMPWWKFHVTIIGTFFVLNCMFAIVFMLLGPHAIQGMEVHSVPEQFVQDFFFSVQSFTTVGYGHLSPNGFWSSLVAAFDAFFGLLGFALATSLLFARFSRPTARIMYSNQALIAPYHDGEALMFRIANERDSQLLDVEAKVLYTQMEMVNGRRIRRFYELKLERNKVAFLPLHWTIVHPINDESPIYGFSQDDMREAEAEILILLTAIDDIYSHTVHSRSSYRYNEMVWRAKFMDMFEPTESGHVKVDMRKLHKFEPVDKAEEKQP
ncbi:hypothetical protein JW960_23325 [candidate division KSB1 bacterium]|nr:hypothetical protein [candidate division KSB1 bacterium]